jgi:hypothetical protein
MFDRLKSLPLTIILTVIIWMYAESQVTSARNSTGEVVSNIPVWVSGPPDVLARYDVVVDPGTISVTVAGAPGVIETLRKGNTGLLAIHAYLDITGEDRSSPMLEFRSLRFVLPPGLSVLQAPGGVGFRLLAKTATGK